MAITLPASYSTVALVFQQAPRVGSVSTVTSAIVSDAIGLADGEINAVLANQYDVPVAGPPPLLVSISTNMAAYYTLRRLFTRDRQNKSDWVDEFKDRATSMLENLMDGKLELVTSSGTTITRNANEEAWSNTMGYTPTFSELDETLAIDDEDKLDDLKADRGIS